MKIIHPTSLAGLLSLWIIPLAVLTLLAVLGGNYYFSHALITQYIDQTAEQIADTTAQKIETRFFSVSSNADALSAVIIETGADTGQIADTVKAFVKANDDVFGSTVALEPNKLFENLSDFAPYYYRKQGKIAFADLADQDYHYRKQAWYSQAAQSRAAVWSDPYYDEGGGEVWMITYSTPIFRKKDNAFAGIATADIDLTGLNQIVQQIKVGESGFGFLLSSNDIFIAHPNASLNGKKLTREQISPQVWQKYIDSKSKSETVKLEMPCNQSSGDCQLLIKTLGQTDWKVIIVIPEDDLTSGLNRLTQKVTLIAIIGLLLLYLTVTITARHLTSPLAKLADATRDIGTGNLEASLPVAVRDDEIGALTDDFSAMRDALKNYIIEVKESTARHQKLESEIQIAKDIQMSMIPGAGNAIISQPDYQLYATLKPARSVGGDLYYFQQKDDVLDFIIGDVSDKGVPAALFMAKTVTLYTRALRDGLSPGQTFTMMNDLLSQNNDACMFVTALCGRIDLKDGSIVMANAGHMNPILSTTGGAAEQDVNGATALGLMEGVDYPDITFSLQKNTSLVMYTDGISEAHDTAEQQYGDEKLIELTASLDTDDVEKAGDTIIDSVEKFAAGTEQFDDITLLIVHYV